MIQAFRETGDHSKDSDNMTSFLLDGMSCVSVVAQSWQMVKGTIEQVMCWFTYVVCLRLLLVRVRNSTMLCIFQQTFHPTFWSKNSMATWQRCFYEKKRLKYNISSISKGWGRYFKAESGEATSYSLKLVMLEDTTLLFCASRNCKHWCDFTSRNICVQQC